MPLAVLLLAMLAACVRRVPPSSAGGERALRVLVLNMHAGTDARGGRNLERVAALVHDTGADVVLLQEVDSATARSGRVDQLAELRRLTGYDGAFGRTLAYQGGGYGIAVLSRHRIAARAMTTLPAVPPPQRGGGPHEPRGALYAAVSLGTDTVHLLDTHLDASADDAYRRREAAALAAAARRLAARGGTVLVGGDMNSTPESAVQAGLSAAGLRDLWPECGAGEGLTYPAAAPAKRIDYLYALGDVRCTAARVIDSDASDHRGVLFALRLGGR